MKFNQKTVPGGEWVEIIQITYMDGTPLSEEHWRQELVGGFCLCWIAGGLRHRQLYFREHVRLINGMPIVCRLGYHQKSPSAIGQPVQVEPGVFAVVTEDFIFRMRVLSKTEATVMTNAVHTAVKKYRDFQLDRITLADPFIKSAVDPLAKAAGNVKQKTGKKWSFS